MFSISLKIIFLLLIINFAPPLLTVYFEECGNLPIDRGRKFLDGKPIFGPHKTYRGFIGGILSGVTVGVMFGFPIWLGLCTGTLSMLGDLISSFIKRRIEQPSGTIAPVLDQAFEGFLPLMLLGPYCQLSSWHILFLGALFCFVAFIGSHFFKIILSSTPFGRYSRKVRPRIRLREWRACDIAYNRLHPLMNFERAFYYHFLMKAFFKILRLYDQGIANALNIRLRKICFEFKDLPVEFDGYTILYLSDLHLDGLPGITQEIQRIVKSLSVDVCLLGGDYRTELSGPYSKVLLHMHRLLKSVHARDGVFAVLGNHDCLEMVPPLENKAICFLINDAAAIEKNGQRLWIVGVDDPHYYHADDLGLAYKKVPDSEFSILLAHSPEIYATAAHYGTRLYLCGHTHAGQIQVPKLGPLFTHIRVSRKYCQDRWRYQNMLGYTSAGAGVSGIPVRFGCQGEVVHITLKRN
jgi:predicted MPP superfamily phosphohydrolase